MGRRLKGHIRLLRDRVFEVELGVGKWLLGLVAEMGRRLGVS